MVRISIADLRAEDIRWKPGGATFNSDSLKLAQLSEHRGRKVTYDFLAEVKMGDPDNRSPIVVGAIPRLQECLSVLYRVPASRRLRRGAELLADDDPESETFTELARRACLDNVWQLVDAKRNLHRQALISFVESASRRAVQARIVEPHSLFRRPTPSAADTVEEDEALALLILDDIEPTLQRWQLYQHDDDGTWRCWVVDGSSALAGPQPYGEEGIIPFAEVPLLLVYDDLPAGRAWLPIPESRLDFTLNVSALANDLAYLVKMEAHTIKAIITANPRTAPKKLGPDQLAVLEEGSDIKALATSPHIADSAKTIESMLAMLAIAESLPPDYFSANRAMHTGPALKVAERDLEARRQRQQPLALEDERRAFQKMRAIHNYFARGWGVRPLGEDLSLSVSFSRQWQPTDTKELQQAAMNDLAIGAMSMIGYLMERYNCDRAAAIEIYEEVQADRDAYPVKDQQNPAALIDGTNPSLGTGAAAKTPGAFNPDLATSTDGASVVDAVRAGQVAPPLQ